MPAIWLGCSNPYVLYTLCGLLRGIHRFRVAHSDTFITRRTPEWRGSFGERGRDTRIDPDIYLRVKLPASHTRIDLSLALAGTPGRNNGQCTELEGACVVVD